jgi:hypothetical protein
MYSERISKDIMKTVPRRREKDGLGNQIQNDKQKIEKIAL